MSVCTVFKSCLTFLQNKKEVGLMVDVFLRICSKAQCPMKELCLTTLLFRLQPSDEGDGVSEVVGYWNSHHVQQLDPNR